MRGLRLRAGRGRAARALRPASGGAPRGRGGPGLQAPPGRQRGRGQRRDGRARAGDGRGAGGAQARGQRRQRSVRDDPGRRARGAAAGPRRELRRRGGRARRRDRPLDRPPGGRARRRGRRSTCSPWSTSRRATTSAPCSPRPARRSSAIAPRDFDLVEIPFPERGRAAPDRERRPGAPDARQPSQRRRGGRRLMLDERLARHLHVESLRHRDLHPEHEPHVLFQASTIGALLDGAYDGDVSFAELAEHGDLGLGTLNALDGEMIALDGRFYRADVDGLVEEIAPSERTPFAALAWFEPSLERTLQGPLVHERDAGRARRASPPTPEASCALRIDGEFERVRARSVPRQLPPYRPLAEVVADQHVFEFGDGRGDRGRLSVPRLRPRARGRGLSPALHQRRPRARRARARLPAARRGRPARPRGRAARRAAARGRARLRRRSTTPTARAPRGAPSGSRHR